VNLVKRIYQILYPFIIWAGTLLIPFIITLLLLWIFTGELKGKDDLEFIWMFVEIGFLVSIPAVILFAIVYYVCLVSARSNKFIKQALHITNVINIIGTMAWMAGRDLSFGLILMFIGFGILFIPSALLIRYLKIPQKGN
jgi:hypothetical protein